MTPANLRLDLYVDKTHGEVSGGKSPGCIWHRLIGNSLRVSSSLAINDNGLKWQALDNKNSKGVKPQKKQWHQFEAVYWPQWIVSPGKSKRIVQPIKWDIIWCIHLRGLKKLAFVLTKAMGLLSVGSNPKNNGEIALLLLEMFWGGKCGSHFLVMVFPCKDRILRILSVRKKRVVHTNENFLLFLLPDRPINLN